MARRTSKVTELSVQNTELIQRVETPYWIPEVLSFRENSSERDEMRL